jgi:hypothetical protein
MLNLTLMNELDMFSLHGRCMLKLDSSRAWLDHGANFACRIKQTNVLFFLDPQTVSVLQVPDTPPKNRERICPVSWKGELKHQPWRKASQPGVIVRVRRLLDLLDRRVGMLLRVWWHVLQQ